MFSGFGISFLFDQKIHSAIRIPKTVPENPEHPEKSRIYPDFGLKKHCILAFYDS
jgi:hypothetical protein